MTILNVARIYLRISTEGQDLMHRNFKMPMHKADAMEGGVMSS